MRLITFLSAFLLLTGMLNAQEPCATELMHQQLLSENEDYRAAWQGWDIPARLEDDSTEYVIPVVVHVIHLGEPVGLGSNISNTQIFQAITKLNSDYRSANGIDTGIRFCLAKRDPEGRPTNGIVRVDGRSVANYQSQGLESSQGSGADETEVKDLSRWPNTQYYNIWVVHRIVGSVAGYAYYPTTYINDGTSIEALFMSGFFSTLSHELGHAFNLRHTFQGDIDGNTCPANDDCSSQGDLICDTPPHRRDDCGGNNPCTVTNEEVMNSVNNFMSYCIAQNRFTPEQRLRMRAAAASYPRNLLAESNGCEVLPERDAGLTINYPLPKSSIIQCGPELEAQFSITNFGSQVITRFGIDAWIDGQLQYATYNTNIANGSSADFTLNILPSNASALHDLSLSVAGVNNSDDGNASNDSMYVSFSLEDSCVVTSVYESMLNEVMLYPNPSSGNELVIAGLTGSTRASIYNVYGDLMMADELNAGPVRINVSHLPSGVYIISLRSGDAQRSMRMVRY